MTNFYGDWRQILAALKLQVLNAMQGEIAPEAVEIIATMLR